MKRLILASLISATSVFAVDRTKQPQPGPAPAAAFPDFATHTLPNGLRIFVIPDDRAPTITLRLQIKGGTLADGGTGISGAAATLLNRGTAKLDAAAFAREVDAIGASLEGSSGQDAIGVSISGLTKFTDRLLELFSDAVRTPVFPEQELAKEKMRSLSALAADKKNPNALAGKLMGRVLFGEHPYGKFRTEESIKAVTRDAVVAFHKNWFAPNNASLVVVGDVNEKEIVAKIGAAFAGWERREVPEIKRDTRLPEIKGVSIHLIDRAESVQSSIIVCHPAPGRNFPDLPELNVVNSTLGGGFSGRLFQNLREKHGYTYGSTSAFGYNAQAGYFQATADTRNEVTVPAIREILGEIARIRGEEVPASELELQRQYNVGNYLLSLESAGRIAGRVQDIELYGLPKDFYKTYATRMAAVTPASAQSLAKKYLSSENVAIVVVGKAEQVKPELEKLGKVALYDADLNPK